VAIAAAAGQTVRVRAEARGAVSFDVVEVVAGGEVVARGSGVIEADLKATSPTWVAARSRARERLADGQFSFAHTSAVYLDVGGGRPRPDAATAGPLLAVLDRTRDWVAQAARCPTERHREHLAEVLGAGRDELRRRQGA
jgi:hypothetical protein